MLQLCAVLLAVTPELTEGRRLYEALRYREAEEQLRLARHDAQATAAERREAYELLAQSLIAQSRVAEGEDVFAELLVLEPNAPAPRETSPKVEEAFARAKRRTYRPDYVKLTQRAAPAGQVVIEVADPWARVSTVSVQGVELARAGGTFAGPLTPGADGPLTAVAKSAAGDPVATLPLQGAAEPVAIAAPPRAVAAPEPAAEASPVTPSSARVPGIALAVAALALGVTGAALLAWGGRDYQAAPTHTFASEVAALDRSAALKGNTGAVLLGTALVAGGASVVLFVAF
ncbi:MAG: hypothetical protein IPJ65_28870 [Archangiaceae bacterium]|nr:hypothetical protein [Archangiaceae bacterium]